MSFEECLNEAETCMRLIDPKLKQSGWDLEHVKRELQITRGKIVPDGRSGKRNDPLKADYVLLIAPNKKIAVIEAKSVDKEPGHGLQQALDYADKLDLHFAYSTNGHGIVEYDKITRQQKKIERFPTPSELLERWNKVMNFDEEQMHTLLAPFNQQAKDPSGSFMQPRYYQEIAVNAATASILAGKKRVLLTMATGTGKTFVAFQLAYRLWNNQKPRPKILYLADRDVLLEQAKDQEFATFGEARTRIQRKPNLAYDVYFALYQALDVYKGEEELYRGYPRDFFDYVIIDECHRGGPNEGGEWRKILDYFDSAIHVGMTATPKRDEDNLDTYDYFGQPVYTYSLRQGIEDGFLAPYIIHQVNLEIDQKGYIPKPKELDLDGKLLEYKTYGIKDFDRILKVDERRKTVAVHLLDFLKNNKAIYDKTIIFCQTSEHALAMTELIRNYSGENYDYCVRIVSDEGDIGRMYLDRFQTPNRDFPVIAVTSKLLSTGVDVPTCRVIVLDKSINSMTEFKQIIGRGTRVFEPKDKMWFTIIDYRNVTRLFKDDDWDGPAETITEEQQCTITKEKELLIKKRAEEKRNSPPIPQEDSEDEKTKIETFHIKGNEVKIIGEKVMIFDQSINGNRLISYQDFTGEQVRRLVNDDDRELYRIWTEPEKRKHFVDELKKIGVTINHLKEVSQFKGIDALDMLLHFAFHSNLKTRMQRVDGVRKKAFLQKYPEKARAVLDLILDHYAEEGYQELEPDDPRVLNLDKFRKFGGGDYTIINKVFEGPENYRKAMIELIQEIYKV